MPSLNWIGKDKVINYHQEVPYRVLEKKYDFNCNTTSRNMIIHGDNLEALKSLLPKYEGNIKCIYIDPPYNTGNEGWIYNDNVNDPEIKAWLGNVVGKEGEDMTRHDKWLCMMYPRLSLMHKLLSENGVIFISVDDNEVFYLKAVCDEIFGLNCYVGDISWQRTYSQRNDAKGLAVEVEHILVYGKEPEWQPKRLERTAEMNSLYKNPDNDPNGEWSSVIATAPSASTHQGMVYAIQNPVTGEMVYPPQGRCWPYQQQQMLSIMNEWCGYELKDLNDVKKRAEVCGVSENEVREDVLGIVLSSSLEQSKADFERRQANGKWPELFFTKNGYGSIRKKAYINKVAGRIVTNYWSFEEVGHTDEAKKEIKAIFDGKSIFDTPKPTRLIDRIIDIACEDGDYILDCFAGSGTTAHSAMLSKKNVNYILIEMGDYANDITAERIKRVIKGYGQGKNKVTGCGGSFSFYELGERLFDIDGNINTQISEDKIKEYIWFMETRSKDKPALSDDLLGIWNNTAYYFLYNKSERTTLDLNYLSTITEKQDCYVIYADVCTIADTDLVKWNIIFKKIPRDISKL